MNLYFEFFWIIFLISLFVLFYNRNNNGKIYLRPFIFLQTRYNINSRKKRINQIRSKCHAPDKTLSLVADMGFIAVNVIVAYLLLSHILLFAAVMTGSMTGTVNKGDLILMTSVGEIEVGDIIMFISPQIPYPVTHRVYDITPSGIKTKGDASNDPDSWIIHEEDIQAQAVMIFEKPIVIPTVGNYFIVGDEYDRSQKINSARGDEYAIAKKLINMIKSYGVVIFIIVLLYSLSGLFKGD